MSDVLTRPTGGTALFVEADRKTILVRRRIKHHCTREEWDSPSLRAAKIAEAWRLTATTIRSEGETLVSPSPVELYRDPITGAVVCADIRMPGQGARWIDVQGHPLLWPPRLIGLRRERTTYEHWAEGPLVYTGDHAAIAAALDPLTQQSLQRVRHQNAALRAKIDAAVAPAFDPVALDAGHPEFVDFRVRGIFERSDLRTVQSKQTGEAARLILADGTVEIRDHDPADLTG